MRTLEIEWKHLEKDDATCFRCAETGATVKDFIENMNDTCLEEGIRISLQETVLDEDRIPESNSLSFNGMLLEDVLENLKVSQNYCGSCTELTGTRTYCRTVERDGETYEEIPESIIWDAACRVMQCQCKNLREGKAL
ncbi:MAG: DUF2703 domain-containing protein [Gammaproteobacteria bacterium]|nr:DUF2703 domain-containing protein [Gammaproteobacteria bacterium]